MHFKYNLLYISINSLFRDDENRFFEGFFLDKRRSAFCRIRREGDCISFDASKYEILIRSLFIKVLSESGTSFEVDVFCRSAFSFSLTPLAFAAGSDSLSSESLDTINIFFFGLIYRYHIIVIRIVIKMSFLHDTTFASSLFFIRYFWV